MRRTRNAWLPRGDNVAFGLERVGLLAIRHPRIGAAVLAVIAAVAVYGLFHLSIDRNLRDLFRSDTPAYRAYLDTAAAFADPENQILVLVEGGELTTPEGLQRLLDLHLDLQLLQGVGSVYSLFSLRSAPDAAGETTPLVGDRSHGLTPELIAAIRAHPLMGENLVSADGSAIAFFIGNAEPRASLQSQQALIDAVQQTVRDAFAGTGVHAAVTGLAAVRAEIVALLKRDQLVLNGSGILIGFVLSFIFFRSLAAALMTAVPAMLAGLALIGWSGALGVPVTIVSNVVPVLVMILGYADGMHLTSAWRRARDRGLSVRAAGRSAMREAAAPCMLTALTMAVAFLSMTLSPVTMVRNFGLMGAIGSVAGTWIILAAHAIGGLAIGRFWRRDGHMAKTPLGWLAAPTAALTRRVVKRAWPIAILSVPLTAIFGVLFLAVPPDYSVRETLPPNSDATAALSVVDASLGGAFPVEIVLPMPAAEVLSPQGLAAIRAVHEAAASVPGVASTLSLWSLAAWLGDDAAKASEDLPRLLEQLPEATRSRLTGAPGALVTANITELRTTETLALVGRIEAAVTAVYPQAYVTGATVVGARESTRAINQLNSCLGLAIAGGLILIALAMRSILIAVVAIIPNVLPDMATGSILYFIGNGMQLTSIVALTIAFGIAVDDTVHYLSVLSRKSGDIAQRAIDASREIGPVMIATTLIIVVGMAMTLTSGLRTMVTFGMIVVVSLLMAMIGDLVFLPAIAAGPARKWFARKKAPAGTRESAAGAPPEGAARADLPQA